MILFGVPVDPDEQITPRIFSGLMYGGLWRWKWNWKWFKGGLVGHVRNDLIALNIDKS